eukprot:jgi/Hompol1/4274/HPOL_007026-RA
MSIDSTTTYYFNNGQSSRIGILFTRDGYFNVSDSGMIVAKNPYQPFAVASFSFWITIDTGSMNMQTV